MGIIKNDGWDFIKGFSHNFNVVNKPDDVGVLVEIDDEV